MYVGIATRLRPRSTLFLAALIGAGLLACGGVRPIPVPAGGPTALPEAVLLESGEGRKLIDPGARALLERIARFRALAREIDDRLWPGWSPESLPIAVKLDADRWLLVNHEDPPPGMDLVAQDVVTCLVFLGALDREAARDGVYPMRGKMTAMIISSANDPIQDDQEAFLAKLFQLSAFHRLQSSHAFIDIESVSALSDPPLLHRDAKARALLRLEARLLEDALESRQQEGMLEALNAFLKVRLERLEGANPFQREREKSLEEREGMALYLGFKAEELVREKARLVHELGKEDGNPAEDESLEGPTATCRLVMEKRSRLLDLAGGDAIGLGPAGHYILGMVQAYLLDRLDRDWKKRLMNDPSLGLAGLLERTLEAHSFSTEDLPLDDVLDRYDYYAILEEEARRNLDIVLDTMIRM
jgi:hypothetical protein